MREKRCIVLDETTVHTSKKLRQEKEGFCSDEHIQIVDFIAVDSCRSYVSTMKALNFQDGIPQFLLILSMTAF